MTDSTPRKGRRLAVALPAIAVEHFETEVLHQWEFVRRGTSLIDAGLQRGGLDTFWFGLHSTMSALGNISKVFYTAGGPNPRCAEMRKLFGVSDKALLGNRKVRNGLEHFDERIDSWAATSKHHNLADRNVLSPSAIVGLDPSDFARNYDPASAVISVFGEAIDLTQLIAETEAIVARVRASQQARHAARFGGH